MTDEPEAELVEDAPPVVTADDVEEAGPPAPITPASSAAQHESRVGFENQVNAQVEAFLAEVRGVATETFLAGGTIELIHHLPESSGKEIAPETALAAVADEGLTPYGEWSKDELAAEAKTRGLPSSGTKAELIGALEADDAEDAAALTPKS